MVASTVGPITPALPRFPSLLSCPDHPFASEPLVTCQQTTGTLSTAPGTKTLTDVTRCHSSPFHTSQWEGSPCVSVMCPSRGPLACKAQSGLVVSVMGCLARKARQHDTSPALCGQRWRLPVMPRWGCLAAPLCQLHPPVIHPEADVIKTPPQLRSLDFWLSLRLT